MLLSYIKTDYRDISFSELEINGQFEVQENGIYFPPDQEIQIAWSGIAGRMCSITFIPLTIHHTISIDWGDYTDERYFFSNPGVENQAKHNYALSINEPLIRRVFFFPLYSLSFWPSS